MRFKIMIVIFLILNLAGCATAQKKGTLSQEIKQHEMRITALQEELQRKDERIGRLEKELASVRSAKPQKTTQTAKPAQTSMESTPANIQKSLKNAGLYTGPIDCKIGGNTKNAIIEFQKLNGLKPDGIVGKKTWARLQEFLY